ncbi:MAG: metalloregulator ArsR/SmtB family transcription factor [Oligoflexia bacterium]|nr:metalloregulator ArsR/SmtB family transcription factor [Oligoflexia bacterium]
MVNIEAVELDGIFYALADPTRRQILKMLGEQTRSITELAEPFRMTLAAVSKHIKVLERAKLVKRTKQGRVHQCELDAAPLAKAEECIRFYQDFWNERLDALALYLEREPNAGKKRK